MENCPHEEFEAAVQVDRIKNYDGSVDAYLAHLVIQCAKCKLPFQFQGIPVEKQSIAEPVCDIDRTKLTIPIEPMSIEELLDMQYRRLLEDNEED